MAGIDWIQAGSYTDIYYHKAEGIAKITIARPEVRNAFRPLTVQEMSAALAHKLSYMNMKFDACLRNFSYTAATGCKTHLWVFL